MATTSRAVRVPGAAAVSEPIGATAGPDLGDLPNAIDIDVPNLLGPVLTRQGWVCPPDRTLEQLARLREKLAA